MTFFDTNVLVYFTINQDNQKQIRSQKLIEEAIGTNLFFITPLVFSEYIFVLAKIKMLERSQKKVEFFKKFVQSEISADIVYESYKLCAKNNFCKNINDAIHLKVAEKYCTKLVTFDRDFKKLQTFTKLDIDIVVP